MAISIATEIDDDSARRGVSDEDTGVAADDPEIDRGAPRWHRMGRER
jgi:hypothetical protein